MYIQPVDRVEILDQRRWHPQWLQCALFILTSPPVCGGLTSPGMHISQNRLINKVSPERHGQRGMYGIAPFLKQWFVYSDLNASPLNWQSVMINHLSPAPCQPDIDPCMHTVVTVAGLGPENSHCPVSECTDGRKSHSLINYCLLALWLQTFIYMRMPDPLPLSDLYFRYCVCDTLPFSHRGNICSIASRMSDGPAILKSSKDGAFVRASISL